MTAAIATFLATGVPTALGGAFFFRILRERDVDAITSWWTTFFVVLGTTLFPYGTLLQGHAPAAAWLLAFFWAVFPAVGAPGPRRAVFAGVAASGALATEYLTGPPLVLLAIAALVEHRAEGRKLTPLAGRVVLGAIPGLCLLGYYHARAFGSPFDLGYRHVALPFFQEKMSVGLLGITAPDPVVAGRLLFGPYRGLFFASPVLLLACWGWVDWMRDRKRRVEGVAAALATAIEIKTVETGRGIGMG
jgi:hypothetical protein